MFRSSRTVSRDTAADGDPHPARSAGADGCASIDGLPHHRVRLLRAALVVGRRKPDPLHRRPPPRWTPPNLLPPPPPPPPPPPRPPPGFGPPRPRPPTPGPPPTGTASPGRKAARCR